MNTDEAMKWQENGWGLPEQVVSRCAVRKGLRAGDIVVCDTLGDEVGVVVMKRDGCVLVRHKNGMLDGWFEDGRVFLVLGVEEMQDRIERARGMAAKKRVYAKGGLLAVEKMMADGAEGDSAEVSGGGAPSRRRFRKGDVVRWNSSSAIMFEVMEDESKYGMVKVFLDNKPTFAEGYALVCAAENRVDLN